jgi:hypothetical protein
MGNEFKIKKGFISEGDSKVNGVLSVLKLMVYYLHKPLILQQPQHLIL